MKEIWKPIIGYEGSYEVSNLGRVKSLKRKRVPEKILSTSSVRGYLRVALFKGGKEKKFLVHRLVAESFIPNPDNKPQINHINENRNDNNVLNLEWCTAKENCNHGTHGEKISKARMNCKRLSKEVDCYTKKGVFVACFPSGREAQRKLGVSSCDISNCIAGRQKTAGGYVWKYREVKGEQ